MNNPSRQIVTPPFGPITSKIALVNEVPGDEELYVERQLDILLSQSGLISSNLRYLHLMPIRPPGGKFDVFWEDKKQKTPKPILKKGIRFLYKNLCAMPNLELIIAMGRQPMFVLSREKQDGISKWRGSITPVEINNNTTVNMVSTYSPAHALKQWNINPLILHDLKRAKGEIDNPRPLPKRTLNCYPTRDEIEAYFDTYMTMGKDRPVLYCDIETLPDMITRISFAYSPEYAISIPFFNLDTWKTTHWFYDDWVWQLIRDTMLNSPVGGQNFGCYDRIWLLKKKRVVINKLVTDTMIAQHNIMSGLGSGGDENKRLGKKSSTGMKPFSLEMLCSIFTRTPFYKDTGKITKKKKPTDLAYGKYSCLDSAVTCEVGINQTKTAAFKRKKKFYDHEMELINGPIWYMMQRGIRVDVGLQKKLHTRYSNELELLELMANDNAGKSINLASPLQLAELLYDDMKLKGSKDRSTSAENLLILKAKYPDNEILNLIIQHRKISKIKENILEAKVDSDSRMRCAYSPTTISGRFKSYTNPFDTGTNLQNIPNRRDKNIRPMFMADKGCYLVEADLQGAELYPVAYHSNDVNMIHLLETGADIHHRTGQICLSKQDITKDDRETGKTVGHGSNYRMSFIGLIRILRLWNGINMSQMKAKQMMNRYYAYFSGIPLWHKKVESTLSSQNMTLINALGREIKFFDRYGPELFRKAINWLAQSCVADLLNMIMLDWFKKYNDNSIELVKNVSGVYERYNPIINKGYKTGSELLMQLHDAFYTQCPKPYIHQHLDNLKGCFNRPITINKHTIVIPVKFKVTEVWKGEIIKI